jgi:hypothetical protein
VALIKTFIFTFLKFAMFLFLFFVGGIGILPLFHFPSLVTKFAAGTRGFQWDGVVLMLALYVLILLIEAVRRRLRSLAPWTTLALLLASIAGLAMKFGFMTIEQ